nr:PD-(D/E)XK nuclease family protein [uncultured Halomonas sp.]
MTITAQHANTFITAMQQLLSKPEFPRLARYNQERSWLEYFPLRESHYCSLLEWLLCPGEGHGLGDFFLKQLLTEANTTALANISSPMAKRFTQRLRDKMWLAVDELLINPLQATLVAREVAITGGRRIDLLIVDPIMELVVVLERKDGTKVNSGQLPYYQRWVESNYPDYYQLYILSDSQQFDHGLEDAIDWIQLDDSWLVSALKEALIPGRLPEGMHQRFEDLLYHFDTEGLHREPFYRGIETELDDFALRNRDIIQQLRNNPITELSYHAILTEHLPSADASEESEIRRALLLACRYPGLLGYLLMLDSLKGLSVQLVDYHRGESLAFDTYDEALHIGTRSMQAACEAEDIADWPVYVSLIMPHQPPHSPEESQNDLRLSKPTLSITLDLLAMGEDQQDQARELAKSHGLIPKRRWATKRLELPSEASALNDLARLTPWIQEMCTMARKLGY